MQRLLGNGGLGSQQRQQVLEDGRQQIMREYEAARRELEAQHQRIRERQQWAYQWGDFNPAPTNRTTAPRPAPPERRTGSLTQRDLDNLLASFEGKIPVDGTDILGFGTQGEGLLPYAYTSKGGFMLTYHRAPTGPIMVNLDIGIEVQPQYLVEYRQAVLDIVDNMRSCGSEIKRAIPLGMTAFFAGPGRATNASRDDLGAMELIHRRGMESVFYLPRQGEPRWYLSGWDDQEDPPLYFLCRLPHRVETVDEAREALKPQSVKTAMAQGKTVKRQGDLFAIRSDLTTEDIEAAGGKFFNTGARIEDRKLYGTIHTAPVVARLPEGLMLATDRLIHDPSLNGTGRRPDHQPMELDDGWWFIMKNTVPVSGAAPVRNASRDPRINLNMIFQDSPWIPNAQDLSVGSSYEVVGFGDPEPVRTFAPRRPRLSHDPVSDTYTYFPDTYTTFTPPGVNE